MLFAVEVAPEFWVAVSGAVGGGGVVGLLMRLLRAAGTTVGTTVPAIVENFGNFVTSQIDAAKQDREAGATERAALMAAHAKQMEQRDLMFMAELERRDKIFAGELARLTDAVGRNTAVTEALSATVAVLAARVGVEAESKPEQAPMPTPARGSRKPPPLPGA